MQSPMFGEERVYKKRTPREILPRGLLKDVERSSYRCFSLYGNALEAAHRGRWTGVPTDIPMDDYFIRMATA